MKDFIYFLKQINKLTKSRKIICFVLLIIVLYFTVVIVKELTIPVIITSFATSYMYDTCKMVKQNYLETVQIAKEKEKNLTETKEKEAVK